MRGRTDRKRRLKNLKNLHLELQNDKIYNLTKWMGESGFKPTKKLRPKIFKDSGRGLMAEEAIYPGDAIVSIPQNLLITPKSVLNSYLGYFLDRFCPKATGHEILSVFLMCEHAKGELSEWHPYITSLPQRYNIPVYFCQHSLSTLPKPIYLSAKMQCESVKNSFSQLQPLLFELQTAYPAFNDAMNYDIYKWAWSSVNTRCIFIECIDGNCSGSQCMYHLALAPFLDLLNHSLNVQVHAGFNKEKNHYEIISYNKFKKYSQVFISYGCHDNKKLFLEYGFVIPDNYNDHVSFSLDDILLAYKLCNLSSTGLHPKLKYIEDNNLLKNAVCSSDGISWNLGIIMKILLSEYNIRLWNSLLHTVFNQETDDSEFQKFKKTLINIKIDEYKLNSPDSDCSECSSYQCLISTLCSVHCSILINALL